MYCYNTLNKVKFDMYEIIIIMDVTKNKVFNRKDNEDFVE